VFLIEPFVEDQDAARAGPARNLCGDRKMASSDGLPSSADEGFMSMEQCGALAA
jgi:hypothetical protein